MAVPRAKVTLKVTKTSYTKHQYETEAAQTHFANDSLKVLSSFLK